MFAIPSANILSAARRIADAYGMWLILALGTVSRFIGLGYPHKLVFDETYYVKDAWTLGNLGYEGSWPADANSSFEAGITNGFTSEPSFVVHPPLGKWIIFLGMRLWGADNSVGWRFSVALLSIASIWLIYLVASRLFESKRWALVPAFLLAIDGHAIVLGRTGLLDGILAFFALLAFYFLLRDRASRNANLLKRPWLAAMALTLGLATGVKWSGLYLLATFAVYVVVSDLLIERRAHHTTSEATVEPFAWIPRLLARGFATATVTVPLAFITYLSTWTGWLVTQGGYDRQTAPSDSEVADWLAWIPQPLQALWHYHVQAYGFHVNLHTPHNYASSPLTWLFLWRPTSFFYEGSDAGTPSCPSTENCANAITALGNPLIWAMALLALVALSIAWFRTRDSKIGLILLGIVGGYLPWLLYLNRTTFQFYAVVFLPWMLLAVGYWLKTQVSLASPERRKIVYRRVMVALGASLLLSVFFSSIWLGYTTDYWYWRIHMWLPSWI
jgi:dolichyl-phosphate-mannose--protein O-mannosyl transferase